MKRRAHRLALLAAALGTATFSAACGHDWVVDPPPTAQPSPSPSPALPVGIPEATALENLDLIGALERSLRPSSRLVSISATMADPSSGRVANDESWTYGYADIDRSVYYWNVESTGRVRYFGLGAFAHLRDLTDLRGVLNVDSDHAVAVALESGARAYVDRYPSARAAAACSFLAGLPTWEIAFNAPLSGARCRVWSFVNGANGRLLHIQDECVPAP